MSQYDNLKATIALNVYENHRNQVTANMVKAAMNAMTDSLGAGYQYLGIATPTSPGTAQTPDQKVFYIATTPGTYTYLGGLVVNDGEVAVLKWDTAWHKEVTGAATSAQVTELGQKIDDLALGKFYGFFPAAADLPAGDDPGYAYVGASSPFAIYVFKDGAWSDSGSVYGPAEGNGEDIDTNAQGKLQFADRPNTDGMGYVILRKDKTFSEQVGDSNTIYEIRYDFDLGGASVTIPAGCVLKFVGGSISNGTIDLNSDCEIIGSGIKCLIANPSVKPMPLSCYLADVSDTQRNNAVVQTLLDAGVAIFDDIPAIEFSNYLSVKGTIHFEGVGKRKAVRFPQSRGFVWDTIADSNRNYFAFLAISANGDAFDFINGGDANRTKNVYFSTFRELTVISTNGDCFSAGVDNKGATGDNCFFDNQFDSIYVVAPNGSGFKGLNSNTILFTKVRSGDCGVSVFYNCAGHIESFNGTWGTTTTFYKGTPPSGSAATARYRLILDNCNIESFKGILFDCNNWRVYMHCIFRQCTFYVNGNNGVIDFHPFNFYYLYQLVWRNNQTYANGNYDNDHCLFYVNRLIDMNYDVDSAILCDTQNSRSYRTTLTADSATQRNGLITTQFANQSYKRIKKIDSDVVRVACVMPKYGTITFNEAPSSVLSRTLFTTNGVLYPFYLVSFDSAIDTEGSISSFNYVDSSGGNYTNNDTMLRFPAWSFIIKNNAINRAIKFNHNYSSSGRFICSTGDAITLNPGQCAKITLFRPIGSSLDYYYIEPIDQNPNAGNNRPTDNLFVGFQFFDKSLSPARPIWWTGTAWVDATGTTV